MQIEEISSSHVLYMHMGHLLTPAYYHVLNFRLKSGMGLANVEPVIAVPTALVAVPCFEE